MDLAAKRDIELILARVVRAILNDPGAFVRMEDISSAAGYSRFHLTRIFQSTTGESASEFGRRIRLERAAWMLMNSPEPIGEISAAAGFASEPAFIRAIRSHYGCSPSKVRRLEGTAWQIFAPSNLHWMPEWRGTMEQELLSRFPLVYERRAPQMLATLVWTGSYSFLGDAWALVAPRFDEAGLGNRPKVAIYLNNLWTYPTKTGMRAILGAELRPDEKPPPGFKTLLLPGGVYVRIDRPLRRTERNDAWRRMSADFQTAAWSFDRYSSTPLPWEEALTECWVSMF